MMNSVSQEVPKDAPVMKAWEAHTATDEFANTLMWAGKAQRGSLWQCFYAGFFSCAVHVTHQNSAIGDVAFERQRQIESEGWDAEHDDLHDAGELVRAAICYAAPFSFMKISKAGGLVPEHWPWDASWWKPKDERTNLIKAAALLIAEIERLDRRQSNDEQSTYDMWNKE